MCFGQTLLSHAKEPLCRGLTKLILMFQRIYNSKYSFIQKIQDYKYFFPKFLYSKSQLNYVLLITLFLR